ncbi:twin-arginine translocase TatA/TatE family subunit [Nannocystis sp. ILAH1]|uniref:Sec-independent protein translocase subunit TatA/TatB n=1 Tax=Nannocystis sp. ILAH1 TaxID=2996789 RepID=UPI002270FB9B|nr:twin-arginine translocase TatA/TatE family subunit [Nannocystis sp. ILAH1]
MLDTLEIVIIVAVIVSVFGPSRLPALGSSIGQMLRGFRKEMKAIENDEQQDAETRESDDPRKDELRHNRSG